MTFAQILQKMMDSNGLTNYRVGQLLNCHQTTVKNWLNGESEPRKSMIPLICNVFGVTQAQLRGEEPIDYDNLQAPPVNPSVGPAKETVDDMIRKGYENQMSRILLFSMEGATPEEYEEVTKYAIKLRNGR